jgi:hypothetical protein
MTTNIFSPAQCLGYLAFVLGIAAFLQKRDRGLKFLLGIESLAYMVHFGFLGNWPASSCSLLSGVRSFAAIRTRAMWLAGALIIVNIATGAMLSKTPAGWLPVIASCVATIAMFYGRGIPMRLALLSCTLMWLANNIICGSIGGTMLEGSLAVVNTTMIVRMVRANGGSIVLPGRLSETNG